MKSKFKQIAIEDIALQFIKRSDNPTKNNVICSNKT